MTIALLAELTLAVYNHLGSVAAARLVFDSSILGAGATAILLRPKLLTPTNSPSSIAGKRQMIASSTRLLVILFILYWLPSVIALMRHHHSVGGIIALNILLGWTAVGWIVSLVWSLGNAGGGASQTVTIQNIMQGGSINQNQTPSGQLQGPTNLWSGAGSGCNRATPAIDNGGRSGP